MMLKIHSFWNILILVLVIPFGLKAQKIKELGDVTWLRNLSEAKQQADQRDVPIFMLFQEVPGCSTCQRFGQQVLQNALLVEAIEDIFVPLAIYNNKSGHDQEVLELYNEPAWNNPVVRIVNADGRDLLPRLSGHYTPYDVVDYIQKALIAWKAPIPPYLSLLAEELAAKQAGTKETYLSMYCFWSGEKQIGKLPGVMATEAGFMDGKEVVKVRYAPNRITYEELLKNAQSAQCASGAFTDDVVEKNAAAEILSAQEVNHTSSYRKDREDKYYLRRTDLRFVPLTDLQKTRFNSMVAQGLDPSNMLSPRQVEYLSKLDLSEAKSQLDTTLASSEQLK